MRFTGQVTTAGQGSRLEELEHYFHQIASDLPVERAAKELWHNVDTFGEQGSREKELGIEGAILGKQRAP